MENTIKNKIKEHLAILRPPQENNFAESLILSCLSGLRRFKGINEICQEKAAYLLTQFSSLGSVNYYSTTSDSPFAHSYPDDLDDTFCALSALYQFDPSLITGEMLSKATKLLLQTEAAPGGPYNTWLADWKKDSHFQDTDPAVNANISFFLSLQHIHLPRLADHFDHIIRNNLYFSKYYDCPLVTTYFLSRSYRGEYKDLLVEFILNYSNSHKEKLTAQQMALTISSLINLGLREDLRPWIERLCKETWSADDLYIERNKSEIETHFSSSAVTAAFCLEALDRANHISVPSNNDQKRLREKIVTKALLHASFKNRSMEEDCKEAILNIAESKNINEIVLLPIQFAKAVNSTLEVGFLEELSMANLFGWSAHSIYDSFMDTGNSARSLPVANLLYRNSLLLFKNNPSTKEAGETVISFFNKMDEANLWEYDHCRFDKIVYKDKLPQYDNYHYLADKSCGHILPFLLIFFHKDLIGFFQHYIIAKQLSDDAHDWWQDIEKGYFNPVSTILIEEYLLSLNRSSVIPLEEKAELQKYFWNNTVKTINALLLKHLSLAEKRVKNITCLNDPSILTDLLSPIYKSIKKTEEETKRMKEFLSSYLL